MKFHDIKQLSFDECRSEIYDLAIFSCGYERRCRHIPSLLVRNNMKNVIVFGFSEKNEDEERLISNEYFIKNWVSDVTLISSEDDKEIFKCVENIISCNITNQNKILRILVDYSSMSRIWYAGVVSCLLLNNMINSVCVDFCYNEGNYVDEYEQMVIGSIKCLADFEGVKYGSLKNLAIFGLGKDHFAPLCVYDQIEPDLVYTIIPTYINKTFQKNASNANKELLGKEVKNKSFKLPIDNIKTVFRYLIELCSTYKESHNLTIIPMGPKPHVLASIFLCARIREVTCLRVSSPSSRINVDGSDKINITRTTFIR